MLKNIGGYILALSLCLLLEVVIAFLLGYTKISEIISILIVSLVANQIINVYLYVNKHLGISKSPLSSIFFLEIIVLFVTWLLLYLIFQHNPEMLLLLSIALTLVSYFGGAYIFPIFTARQH